jgi:hypothetical protein
MIKNTFACLFLFVTFAFGSNRTDENHLTIVLRTIGHELLLKSADSTSRVLPIEKVAENSYQLSFEHEFSFVTDTLINTINSILTKEGMKKPYQVLVRSCETQKVIYAYEVSSATDFLIPCTGITNPKDCYEVQIDFPEDDTSFNSWLLLLVIPFLGFFFYRYYQRKKPTNEIQMEDGQNTIKIGNINIQLSDQESKLFQLLSEADGQVVKREILLYEIWEKDGTIVSSRSLDVLVSKLRKKITEVSNLKIKNVHGKGYKLGTD